MLVELFYEAGFKKEDIQVLVVRDEIMGDLIGHEHINAISFTGSYPVARKIASVAGMRKQLYELGGNDALIVMEDGDISKAVDQTIAQRFGCSGRGVQLRREFMFMSLGMRNIAINSWRKWKS